ncbi:MAG: nucleotidyl transferase AbiEii/AbiGii toxin family protein [Deltaproteobacteria bacterium]
MPRSLLTAFQRQVLETYFRHEKRFFLSGGAALAGFHLGHRATHDLVRDRAPQGELPKLIFGDVRVDPPEEILANKLCALLSRSELRDLIDVRALEQAGFRVEDALPLAQNKDAGLTPAQLAWVLSGIDFAGIPQGRELSAYVESLSRRLVAKAMPSA